MAIRSRPRPRAWRLGTPLVVAACGILFIVSAVNSQGTDLRAGRYTDLPSLVQAEKEQTEALTRRVSRLESDNGRLSTSLGDRAVSRYQDEIEELEDPAGLTPVRGSAVQVTLVDAEPDVIEAALAEDPETNRNDYVVHQQDIQAVANAMWHAGAEAVTIQGQRLISTTGIKCEGNSVTLHGVPYAPPYEIVAIGDQEVITDALEDDVALQIYRAYASAPGGGVGWDTELIDDHTAPAFSGVLTLDYAEPVAS
jgi:uncharacterized protein YlxW (UPF0749 family)